MTAIEARDDVVCDGCGKRDRCVELRLRGGRMLASMCLECIKEAEDMWWAGQPRGGQP